MSWDDAVERLVGSCGSRPAAGSYAATAQLVSQAGVLKVKSPPPTLIFACTRGPRRVVEVTLMPSSSGSCDFKFRVHSGERGGDVHEPGHESPRMLVARWL